MRSSPRPWLLLVTLGLSLVARAEDPDKTRAREELERQLKQMVGSTPTRVKVELEALDEPNYVLEEAAFELDGAALKAPGIQALAADGTHLVWAGEVKPGKHSVHVRLVYANRASAVVSDEGGYKWALNGERTFDLPSGIEVQVKLKANRDGTQRDLKNRFKLATSATPVMLAALDDGKMPEPPLKAKVEAPDAGVAAADAAAERKRLAEEARQKKIEELAEKKRLAEEERQRKHEEAEERKRVAAEARRKKIEEAAEKRKLAAEEKQRKADEAAGKKVAVAEPVKPPQPLAEKPAEPAPVAVAAAEVDAGPPAIVDAGLPVVAAAAPAVPAAEPGFPWAVVLGAAGGAGLVLMLMVIARRRSRPPSIE